MRLERFDLVRYGHFTDFAIELGQRDGSKPDLHIVYGPNESGKSTFFAAYLDLLFGIERKSPYNFKHSYASMRVGARLDTGASTLEVARIKKDRDSLRSHSDEPLPEQLLRNFLGTLDRESYASMFSLNDETLKAGGESILASRGELGRLLFSATSGISEIAQKIDHERENAHAFYRQGARSTELRELKERLRSLEKERYTLDLQATQYADLKRQRDAAKKSTKRFFINMR